MVSNFVNEAFSFFYFVNACQWVVNGFFVCKLLIVCVVNVVNVVNAKNRAKVKKYFFL